MLTQYPALITFLGYMLPVCIVVPIIIGFMVLSGRSAKKYLARAEESAQLARDIKHILEELVAVQKENNRLLTQQQESRREQ